MGALSGIRTTAARDHASKPFVTDCTNGMRTELSGTVFEQWVAKTTNWLDAEFGSGVLLHVDLRPHWLWPVLVAALDELEGALAPADRADAVVCMRARAESDLPVIAIHDHPMAMPFREPLPANHYDFFRDVRGGGDVRSPGASHRATLLFTGFSTHTAEQLLAELPVVEAGQRVALRVDARPIESAAQIATIALLPWATRGSLVLTDGSSNIAGERADIELTLPSAR